MKPLSVATLRKRILILCAVGDKAFNSMMSQIKDRADDGLQFQNKLHKVVQDMPNVFRRQEELEAWVREEVKAINSLSEAVLGKYRAQLRSVMVHFNPSVSLLEALQTCATPPPHVADYGLDALGLNKQSEEAVREFVDGFIAEHKVELRRLVSHMRLEYDKLKGEISKKDWPTGPGSAWRYVGSLSTLDGFIVTLEKEFVPLLK